MMRPAQSRGFTLLEIIVALAILGIGLVVVMELFSGGLRLGRVSVEYGRATEYARAKMEEISLAKDIREGEEEGEFDKDFRWRLGVKKVDLLPGDKGTEFRPPLELFYIKLDVLWKSGLKERTTALESYKTIKPAVEENR